MGSPSVEKFKLLVTGLKQACHEVQFFSRPNFRKGKRGDFYTEKLPSGFMGFCVLPSQGRDAALLFGAQGLSFVGITALLPLFPFVLLRRKSSIEVPCFGSQGSHPEVLP